MCAGISKRRPRRTDGRIPMRIARQTCELSVPRSHATSGMESKHGVREELVFFICLVLNSLAATRGVRAAASSKTETVTRNYADVRIWYSTIELRQVKAGGGVRHILRKNVDRQKYPSEEF
jgi:hypothetical protein